MLGYVVHPQILFLVLSSYLVPLDIAQVFHLIVVEVVFVDLQVSAVNPSPAAKVLQIVPGQLAGNTAF